MKETRPPNESREDKDEVETSFHRFVPPAIEMKLWKEIDLKRGIYLFSFFCFCCCYNIQHEVSGTPRLMCYKSSDLIFDVMAPASCILHLALGGHVGHGGHGHQADRNTKRVWGRWGPLLPAHPPIIISLVSPLLVDPALALQHVAVSLLNCSLGGHNHTEALLCVSVLL